MSIPIRADVLNLLGIFSDAVPLRIRELQVDIVRERTAGHGVQLQNDLIIGLNKIKTQNLLIREYDVNTLALRDINDSAFRNLRLNLLYVNTVTMYTEMIMTDLTKIRTPSSSAYVFYMQSYDGTAFVDNLKLGGGIVEILNGKLVSDLDAGGYTIKNIEMYEADYGGGFLNFTPPTLKVGAIFLARDTNATTPGWRLYAGFSDGWHYVDLT